MVAKTNATSSVIDKITQLNSLSKALKCCNPISESLQLRLYAKIGFNLN
jgi:hypothetical protein